MLIVRKTLNLIADWLENIKDDCWINYVAWKVGKVKNNAQYSTIVGPLNLNKPPSCSANGPSLALHYWRLPLLYTKVLIFVEGRDEQETYDRKPDMAHQAKLEKHQKSLINRAACNNKKVGNNINMKNSK